MFLYGEFPCKGELTASVQGASKKCLFRFKTLFSIPPPSTSPYPAPETVFLDKDNTEDSQVISIPCGGFHDIHVGSHYQGIEYGWCPLGYFHLRCYDCGNWPGGQ